MKSAGRCPPPPIPQKDRAALLSGSSTTKGTVWSASPSARAQAPNSLVRVTRELVRQLRAWITEGGETPAMVETKEALEPPVLLLPNRRQRLRRIRRQNLFRAPRQKTMSRPPASGRLIAVANKRKILAASTTKRVKVEALDEQRLEERFDPAAVPQDVVDALRKPDWPLALKLAIQGRMAR